VPQNARLRLGAVPVFVALAAVLVLAGRGQATIPEESLGAAAARLRSGDAEGAARILELLVTREPRNGRAWRMLGTARQGVKNLDGAIEAWKRAIEVDPSVPTPYYSIGVAYAARQDGERAFVWLGKAKATRKIDMTQIQASPELAPFRSDARFAALLPGPRDFEDAFVEPTRVIREWDGEMANDQFGWIARKLGDVDGDGIPDVVVSAPTSGVGGEKAGRVYVYSTKTGTLLWTTVGHTGDELGTGVESAGDVNGDGIVDVIASAPGGGYASVFSGRDGRMLRTFKAEAKSDDFGRHVSGVGDVDRDGFADVIVGAPTNAAGGKGAGRAYVYSGKTGLALLTLTGEHAGDGFGSAVAGYSDPKVLLLVVGAPTAGARHAGRAFVYSSLQANPQFVIDADETGGALGAMFLSVLGDVDGDGVPDVYASDWSNGAKGPSTGRVYVHSGRDGHRLFALTGETAGEGFGTSPSVAGDVDGDGHADLIVGAWQHSSAAVGGGRAYLYSGKDGRLIKTYTCRTPGDTFGFDAVALGDVDGDGTMDLLVTSGWSGVHGFHSGRVFIISSGVTRPR
jgi:hypothetical protein